MTSFHVRHNFTPALAHEALLLLKKEPIPSIEVLVNRAREHDFELGHRGTADKVVASLRDLGLLCGTTTGHTTLQLTSLGQILLEQTKRDHLLFAEYVHLRYWWQGVLSHAEIPYSWAYRFVATLLWDSSPAVINSDLIVTTVLADAERNFEVDSVSFSSASVQGIMHWIRALSPAVVNVGTIQRRFSCPPEAMAIALEAVNAARGRGPNVPTQLDTSTKRLVCQCLLLEPAALDDALVQAEDALGLVRRQTEGHEVVWLRESVLPGLVSMQERLCQV
jgi:hypothetical protein